VIRAIEGIYAIVDVTADRPPERASRLARELVAGGVRTLQLRAKSLPARRFLELARELRALDAFLVINDRPDIAVLAGADAVHLGQDDLPPAAVRSWIPKEMKLGVSCHDPAQASAAAALADYIGYGPVFPTASKANPDPIVGVEGLAAIKIAHPALPVVAIGGIDLARLPSVKRAGADAAAMISALADRSSAERAIAIWEST
jgi:thiamine-phosphate pyrophosphorylase